MLRRRLCRPSGAPDMTATRRPTAYAVGSFLAPLRGFRSPRIFRLMATQLTSQATHFRPLRGLTS